MAAMSSKNKFSHSMVKCKVTIELSSLVRMEDKHLTTLLGRRYLELDASKDAIVKQHGKILLFIIWYLHQSVHTMQMTKTNKKNLSMMKINIYEMTMPRLLVLFHSDHNLTDLKNSISYEVSEFKENHMVMWAKVSIEEFQIKQWKPETLQKWVEKNPTTPTTNLYSESSFFKAAKQSFQIAPNGRKLKMLQEFQHLFKSKASEKKPEEDFDELVKFTDASSSRK
nr:TPA_asm: M [Sesamum betacytorhabdovirus 1_Cat]